MGLRSLPALLAALALPLAGCGVEEHANEPRPQPPTRISVTVTEDTVRVEPRRVAFGPQRGGRIPQNADAAQPPIPGDAPLDVTIVAANLTDVDSRLELRGEGADATSGPLVAKGAVTMQARLPSGRYEIRAADIPGAEPARLAVGSYRSSSENDLLLP